MLRTWRALAVASIGAAVVLTGAARSSGNEVTEHTTWFGVDTVSAGLGGLRTIGAGTLELSGVTGPVSKAVLYWHGPTDVEETDANATIGFDGTQITGDNIGLASDNCWGYANSQAYRADVTDLVAGDGSYELTGLNDWDRGVDINGVSLVVAFDDVDPSNDRDVVFFDGNDSNIHSEFDPEGWDVSLHGIDYSSGSANITLHVADGQEWADDDVVVNDVVVAAGPQVFRGDTVPDAGSANSMDGGLWDIRPFDVTSLLAPGENSLHLTTGLAGDCLSLVVAAIDLPAGAAPSQPERCAADGGDPGLAGDDTLGQTLHDSPYLAPLDSGVGNPDRKGPVSGPINAILESTPIEVGGDEATCIISLAGPDGDAL